MLHKALGVFSPAGEIGLVFGAFPASTRGRDLGFQERCSPLLGKLSGATNAKNES
jgi:hypothetical protein